MDNQTSAQDLLAALDSLDADIAASLDNLNSIIDDLKQDVDYVRN
jgi:outer membrane murein-binding lipoprotein Lpp